MTSLLFAETTSLGVRRSLVSRTALERSMQHLETPFGTVPVKVAVQPDGSRRIKPEYEVCRTIALERDQPRIQGAMFDADSLLVTYRGFRGEPRGKHKKGQTWEGRGDCIDCNQCVAVCPMGIDIRHGPQLECIQCSLCIDACDQIMDQVGRPRKLIAYDSYRNLEAESHGDRVPIRIIRPRTLLYAGMLAIVTAAMVFAFSRKTVLDVNVVADRNPLFVRLSDGSIRNGYTVRIINKLHDTRPFSIRIEGIPGAHLLTAGQPQTRASINALGMPSKVEDRT